MKNKVGYFSLLAMVSLTGCGIDSALVSPESYAPRSSGTMWSGRQPARHFQKAVPDCGVDLTLAEVIDVSLANNTGTRASWANARSAAAVYAGTEGEFLPNISARAFFNRDRIYGVTRQVLDGETETRYGPRAIMSYTIFDFGQRRATTDAAKFALFSADWEHNRQIQSTVFDVVDGYYSVLTANALKLAFEADLKTAEETLRAAELRFQVGTASISDVLQAKTAMLDAKTTLCAQESAIALSRANLAITMGLPATIDLSLTTLPSELPPEDVSQSVDLLVNLALENRPDLIAAEQSVEQEKMKLKAAERAHLPIIDFNGEFGKTYFQQGKRDPYDYIAHFRLVFPLFSGWQIQNSVKVAKAAVETAESNLEATRLAVFRDVTTAATDVTVAKETLQNNQEFYKAAEEQYRVALTTYKEGVGTLLDVIVAQSSLSEARARQIKTTGQWYISLTKLSLASGVLTPDKPLKTPRDQWTFINDKK